MPVSDVADVPRLAVAQLYHHIDPQQSLLSADRQPGIAALDIATLQSIWNAVAGSDGDDVVDIWCF